MIEMLSATAFTLAEESINRLLQHDSVTLQRLAALSGKVICIRSETPALTAYLLPNDHGLQIHATLAGDPDVTLSGTPADFIRLLTSDEPADALFGKGVTISGDSGLANRFQSVLADARVDWEARLGDIVGDLPAHQFAALVNWKLGSYSRTGRSLIHNLEEYLTEEAQMLPTRPEVEGLLQQVDQVRDRSERLSARLQQLQQQAAQN